MTEDNYIRAIDSSLSNREVVREGGRDAFLLIKTGNPFSILRGGGVARS